MNKSKSVKNYDKIGSVMVIIMLCIIGIIAVACDGAYNLLVFMMLAVIFGLVTGHYIKAAEYQGICTAYCKATVKHIHNESGKIWLILGYDLNGWTYESKVRYYENQYPSIGQDVGLYYDPEQPERCVLKIYKDRQHGWSNRTKKSYMSGIYSLIGLGIVIGGIGVALLVIMTAKIEDYTEAARGEVVYYEEQFDFHAAGIPGTYEYIPVVQYEFDGQTYMGKSVQIQLAKTYNEGESVVVKYDPSNPQSVVIMGDDTTMTGAIFMIVSGAVLLLLAVRCVKRKKEVWAEIEESKTGIKFL